MRTLLLAAGLLVVSLSMARPAQDDREVVPATPMSGDRAKSAGSSDLVLQIGTFDPVRQRLEVKAVGLPDVAFSSRGVVQFESAQVMDPAALAKRGARVLEYLPHNAYLVAWDRPAADAVARMPGVRYAGPFQPAWKLSSALWRETKRSRDAWSLQLTGFRGGDLGELEALVSKIDATAEMVFAYHVGDIPRVRFRPGPDRDALDIARALAPYEAVAHIDRHLRPDPQNADSVGVVQDNRDSGGLPPTNTPLWDRDLIGTGQIVAVADSGVDRNAAHFTFWDDGSGGEVERLFTDAQDLAADEVGTLQPNHKIVGYFVQPGASAYDDREACDDSITAFHGTHVAGSVLADSGTPSSRTEPNYDDGDGMAPHAQLLVQDLGNDDTGCLSGQGGYPMFVQARNAGAGISSNSYGADPADAADDRYFGSDQEVDRASRDLEDLLIILAGGNDGVVPSHPGQAKSALSVAATEHGNDPTVAGFSNPGPAADGRVKPEISAPGVGIRSVGGDDNDDVPPRFPFDDNAILPKSGTSMATPTVAGGTALMRQYFQEGMYPTGQRVADDAIHPSGALLKSVLLNGTALPSNVPNNDVGWGRIWLDNNLYFPGDSRDLRVWDRPNASGLTTGDSEEFTVQVGAGEEFRATLVWFDPAATSSGGLALVNNLDLEVEGPGGVFRGNNISGAQSNAGGGTDNLNTVEQVILPAPEAGSYTVRVIADSVPGNGGADSDRQGYALSVSSAECATAVNGAPDFDVVTGESSVDLSFSDPGGAAGFQIYRALGSCDNLAVDDLKFVGSTGATSFADEDFINGAQYAYRVRAVDACGEGPISACKTAAAPGACALPPVFDAKSLSVTESVGETCSTALSWDAGQAQCADVGIRYNLYRSTEALFTPSSENRIATGLSATSFTDRAVDPLTTYHYAVRAEDTTVGNIGPAGGNETVDVARVRSTPRAPTSSPGTFRDDPDSVSLVSLEAPWQIVDNRASTGQYSYHNSDPGFFYPDQTCARIVSAPVTLQTEGGVPGMSYDVRYDLEQFWDGIIVEITTDGGQTWEDLPPNGGYPSDLRMTSPDGTPINQCGYPETQGAFNGTQNTFETFNTNLSRFAGETVQIRWSFTSDPATVGEGFYLDNIVIRNSTVPDACAKAGVTQDMSGPWFNAEQSGHGWLVEVLDGASTADTVNAYWYVYSDGDPVWLIGTGPVDGARATLDAFVTDGGEFPPDFDGFNLIPWGTLTFDFASETEGTASWDSVLPQFGSGSIAMSRLAPISNSAESCHSGSYYNVDQSGHGFVAEVLDIGGVESIVLAWYVYLNGQQVWLFGQGPLVNDVAEVPMGVFSGADFPPDFDPGTVVNDPWGTVTFTFTGPDAATASWDSDLSEYPDGSLDLIRLTGLSGHACP